MALTPSAEGLIVALRVNSSTALVVKSIVLISKQVDGIALSAF